jgi:hypothetical protein
LAISPYFTMPLISAMMAVFTRLARFEQFDHARQTAGDVLGLGGLARDLGQTSPREPRRRRAPSSERGSASGTSSLRRAGPLICTIGCRFSSGES